MAFSFSYSVVETIVPTLLLPFQYSMLVELWLMLLVNLSEIKQNNLVEVLHILS